MELLLLLLLPMAFWFAGVFDSDDDDDEDQPPTELDPDDGDPIIGTEGDDTLTGTGLNEPISGDAGDDLLIGRGGDDTLLGEEGDDTSRGGAGDDEIRDQSGSDLGRGWTGDDALNFLDDGELGQSDVLFGDAGEDTLWGDDGDTMTGGDGGDVFNVVLGTQDADPVIIKDMDFSRTEENPDPDRVYFRDKDGTVFSQSAFFDGSLNVGIGTSADGTSAFITFNTEEDGNRIVAIIEGYTAEELFFDTAWIGNFAPSESGDRDDGDQIDGTEEDDNLFGGGGEDTIDGMGGEDYIDGQDGDDLILGVDENGDGTVATSDNLIGGDGDDTIRADEGDQVVGGDGKDSYEIVVPFPHGSDPVLIHGYEFQTEDGFPELVTLLDGEGNPLGPVGLADSLEVTLSDDGTGTALIYEGETILVVDGLAPETLADTSNWIANLADPDTVEPPDVEVVELEPDSDIMVLETATETGNLVTTGHFGGNAIFSINTDNGTPPENFEIAQDELGIFHVRYPAGQGDTGDREVDGEGFLDIVKMEPNSEGEMDLRQELKDMLDWAREDGEVQLTLTIPTKTGTVEEYEDFAEDIEAFAEKVMTDYGDVVEAFEIGNEYWSTIGETEYSAKANLAAIALADGMEAAGLEDEDQASIIVQMASPNIGSDFHVSKDDRPFSLRNQLANEAIIEGLSEEAREAIDGVVEHYYYPRTEITFDDSTRELDFINEDLGVWNEAFDKELDLWITEWNVKLTDVAESGLRSASVLAEQFENMLELGADYAHVWPVQHNTDNDLAGRPTQDPVLDEEGRVVNSINGAMFDLMSNSLVGTELITTEFSNDDGSVEINAYQSEDKTVFYVSSRALEELDLEIDFSTLVSEFSEATGIKIGADQSFRSSDGTHFTPRDGYIEAESVIIDGERYYINENDVRAELTDFTFDDTTVSLNLRPFEVMEITFHA